MQVPRLWAFTITGDEFSWILPTLGLWFSSLITRDEQDRAWLNNGRPTCYWLTGFFNPQASAAECLRRVACVLRITPFCRFRRSTTGTLCVRANPSP